MPKHRPRRRLDVGEVRSWSSLACDGIDDLERQAHSPSSTALEDSSPAMELEKACKESYVAAS